MRRVPQLLFACLLAAGAIPSATRAQDAAGPDEEWRGIIAPSLVTVKFNNVPAREAFLQLAELTNNPIVAGEGDRRFEPPVTMEFVNEPFWKAVGALEERVGLRLEAGVETMSYRLSDSPALDPSWTAYVGPARMQLKRITFRREGSIHSGAEIRPPGGTPQMYIELAMSVEPRVAVTTGSMTLTELSDDTGRDLLTGSDGSGSARVAREWGRFHGQVVACGDFTIPLGYPAPEARSVRMLKGRLDLNMTASALPLAVFVKDLERATPWAGTTFSARLSRQAEHVTLQVTTGPSKSPADVRALLPQVRLYGSDESVRIGSLESHKSLPDGGIEARSSFWVTQEVEVTAILVPEMAAPRAQSFEFEMRDIPLPSLKAFYTRLASTDAPVPPARAIPPAPEGFFPLGEARGSAFTLKADGMPLADVAAEIARQTGVRLEAPFETPTRLEQTRQEPFRVTGTWENVEFWPGITAICRETGIALRRSTDSSKADYALWRPPGPRRGGRIFDGFGFIGPVRLRLDCQLRAEGTRFYSVKPVMIEALTLEVRITGEDEFTRVFQRHGASAEECMTSGGVDLLQRLPSVVGPNETIRGFAKPADPRCTGEYKSAGPSELYINLPIPLEPTDVAERIARLRLYYAMETYEGPDRVEIARPEEPFTGCGYPK